MNNLQEEKLHIVQASLKVVAKCGINCGLFKEISQRLEYDPAYIELLFGGGVEEFIEVYFNLMDRKMFELLPDLSTCGVTGRIKAALYARICALGENKLAAAKVMSFLSLPWNWRFALRLSWETVDLIWSEIGKDSSTDFNYYTKRGLLLSVYKAANLYFATDMSDCHLDTKDFIDRRVDTIVNFGKKFGSKKR